MNFLSVYKERFADGFFSQFKSERRLLRAARRKLIQEQPTQERLEKAYKEYVNNIKLPNKKEVALKTQVIFSNTRTEMQLLFQVLHRLTQVYMKLLEDMKRCLVTAQDSKVDELLGAHVIQDLNDDVKIIEQGLNKFIASIEGSESLSLSSRNLIDEASLEQTIAKDLLNEISADKRFKLDLRKLSKQLRKKIQDNAVADAKTASLKEAQKELINRNDIALSQDIKTVVTGLYTISFSTIADLEKVHKKIRLLLDENQGTFQGFERLTVKSMPSIIVLMRVVDQQGWGYPAQPGDQLLSAAKKLEEEYENELRVLEGEIRQLLSKAIRVEGREVTQVRT